MESQKPTVSWFSYLLLMLPPLFWAGNIIAGRAVSTEIPPFTLAWSRWCIALLVVLPFCWKIIRRDKAIYWRNKKIIILTALSGVATFNTLVYWGLQSTAAANALILNSVIPVLIVFMGMLFFRLPVRSIQIAGIALSCSGVLFVVTHGDVALLASLSVQFGDAIILLAMVSWSLYTLWIKDLPAEVNRFGLLGIQFTIGAVCLTPLALWELSLTPLPDYSVTGIAATLYVGIFPSVLAYLCYNASVTTFGPTTTGMSIHLLPIFGVVLSTTLLGESLHLYHLLGAILIFTGILLTTQRQLTTR